MPIHIKISLSTSSKLCLTTEKYQVFVISWYYWIFWFSQNIQSIWEWEDNQQKKISVQLLSHVRLFVTQQTAACQASLFITNSQRLLKLMSIESVMPSNHLILCHPLLFLPSILPSIKAFSDESVLCIRWSKNWSFSFSISPSVEYWGLISFMVDWFWNCLLQIGAWNYVLELEPSQNPVWKSSTHDSDTNPAKTHGTWFHTTC